jgi:Ca-activated chloride channel family protein
MGRRLSFALAALTGVLLAAAPHAQDASSAGCRRDAMVVFDGSGSMSEMGYNMLSEPRIFEARKAVAEAVPRIAPLRRLGLLVYGPGPHGPCGNVDLRFAPRENAAAAIIAEVQALQPEGETPLTDAVKAAADVLHYRERPGEILLVTDGKETCGGDPCALAATLASEARDLTIHVIGFRVRGAHFGFSGRALEDYTGAVSDGVCLADATGGRYFRAETAGELVNAFVEALGCRLLSGLPGGGRSG